MEVFATLAGATIQGQIVGVYHAKRSQVCSMQQNHTRLPADNHTASLNDTTEILHNTVKRGPLLSTHTCMTLNYVYSFEMDS